MRAILQFESWSRDWLVLLVSLLANLCFAGVAASQIHEEVVVGVTTTCPYGLQRCWGSAAATLSKVEYVNSVNPIVDSYNSTGTVLLKNAVLPNPAEWAKLFKKELDQALLFRGIEITADGVVERRGDQIVLIVTGVSDPLVLAPLTERIQWHARKARPRQPEPDEKEAFGLLLSKAKDANKAKVQIIGPLRNRGPQFELEVREYYMSPLKR